MIGTQYKDKAQLRARAGKEGGKSGEKCEKNK
jgi:hypothetical protein